MCGILGIFVNKKFEKKDFDKFEYLLKLSETRGKEASGLCVLSGQNLSDAHLIKSNLAPSDFIKHKDYKRIKNEFSYKSTNQVAMIGHSRMATDGNENNSQNNQPVDTDNLIGIHNGIICNFKNMITDYGLSNKIELDSEAFFESINNLLSQKKNDVSNANIINSSTKLFKEIEGVANIAVLNKNKHELFIGTNNGSLHYFFDDRMFVFASEKTIISQFLKKNKVKGRFKEIHKVESNNGILLNIDDFKLKKINFNIDANYEDIRSKITNVIETNIMSNRTKNITSNNKINFSQYENEFSFFEKKFSNIKRCKKCILSENVPFILFDENGVCSFCNNYQKITYKDISEGKALLNKVTQGKKNNSIIALSGGRDSSFGLHAMVNTFDIKPLAFTYDWGMITDLGRRNISRMCAKLGIEHILITADIRKKRNNIKKNVSAWLESPHLGMIPLFMAGDKQFFYHSNVLKKKYNTNLDVWCFNPYEITTFKDDFSGIKMWDLKKDSKLHTHEVGFTKKIQYSFFYLFQFLKNSKYLNSSLLDTFGAYLSFYFIKKDYFSIFDYVEWDEHKVNETLIQKYNWETDPFMPTTTWRIGDGSSYFYNYIYYSIVGFTETEFLRSRQIRENKITRDQALDLIKRENKPNFEAIKWYCEKIGIEFDNTIKRINQIALNYN